MAQYFYTGSAAPTTTPTVLGGIFVDSTNGNAYISVGTSSSADWKILPQNTSALTIDADLNFGGAYKAINLKGLDFQTFAEYTVSGGVVAPVQTLASIDTEGDASADDIDIITVATDLNMICLKMENASRVPTLKHGTGNLSLPNGSDIAMVNDLLYWFIYDGSNWLLSFDPAGTAATFPVSDSTTLLQGSIDTTKQVRFEVDTNTPTATTRVISTPSADMDMDEIVLNSGTGTDNAVPRFNADGQAIQDSGVLIDDSNNMSGVAKVATDDHLELSEIAAPATPATGKVAVYTKTDGKLYIKDDTGTETDCTGSGGGSSLPVDDTTSIVQDPADNTKQMRIDVGGVTTGNTRVATMPDSDITLGTDADSIHDNVAGEIGAITEKTSIAANDEFIIEDSADSDNKKSSKLKTIRQVVPQTQSGTTYTLAIDDLDVDMTNASAKTVTIPTNASVAFPNNQTLTVRNSGAGDLTLEGDTGVTVNGVSGGGVVIPQYSASTLIKTASDTWFVAASQVNNYQYLGTSGAISSASDVQFTTAEWFDGTYKELIFVLFDLTPATNAVDLYMTGSTDGGSTYLAGTNYQYVITGRHTAPSNIAVTSSGASELRLSGGSLGTASNEFFNGKITLQKPNSSNYKFLRGETSYIDSTPNFAFADFGGAINTVSTIDAVKFAMSSGNISSGEILVYGVRT